MEAKTGNGKGSFSRRKTDALSRQGRVRNLDWGVESSDIALHPQSPLTIAKALKTEASKITLLQSPGSTIESDGTEELNSCRVEKVTPINRIKRKSSASRSAGLLTQLDAEKLKERCKHLIVESALVKHKHEKQLYLAVGFLNWAADPLKDNRQYSPLLFYPVRLINESKIEDERFSHVLYNDDGVPHYNRHLREVFRESTGILLPEFNPRQSLEYFLEKIEACLTGESNAKLEYRMNLGIAISPAGINPNAIKDHKLSILPKRFSKELASRLIENQKVGNLRVTLNLLSASAEYLDSASKESEATDSFPGIIQVREFSVLLSQHGLGNIEFKHLDKLPMQLKAWIDGIEPALGSDLIEKTLEQRDITAIHLMKLAGIVELIDKSPDDLDRYVHRDLAYRGTPLLFKRAKHQALLIEEELSQLQQHFHLDRLPAKSQLLHLIEELGGAHNSDIEVVDSHYFNARRQFMNFSTDKPTTLSKDHKRLLNKLVKVLRFRELFVNNTEYRLALGTAYRGLKTDWARLEAVLEYAQEVRQVLGSESIAATALEKWSEFRKQYTINLDSLQTASTGIRGLLHVVKPSEHTASTAEVVVKGKWVAEQLNKWNQQYGIVSNYRNKTANAMLRVFSTTSGIDANTEKLFQNAKDIIREYAKNNPAIGDRGSDIEQTLVWLRAAVNDESASLENIAHIIEHANSHG